MKIFILIFFNFFKNIYGDFFYFPKENRDSIIIHLEIPIHYLVFLKYKDEYFTEIEISYILYDKNDEIIKAERINEKIEIDKPLKSIDEDSVILKEFAVVDKEEYKKIYVKIKNFEKEWSMERKFQRAHSLILGDLIFLDENDKVLQRIENIGKIKIFLPLYSKFEIDEDFKIEFWRKNKIEKFFKGHLKGKGENNIIKEIDLKDFSSGNYKVRVYFEKSKKYAERTIFFYGSFLFKDEEFEQIVDALSYFAKKEEVDSLRYSPPSERKIRWEKFWGKRDPSPGTPENEFEEEFLRRFYYANENFGIYTPGYRTARGRIYILYGEPDEIERHPFELESYPYEIWYYYSKRLKFVFVDRKGTGEYELVPSDSPKYISPWR